MLETRCPGQDQRYWRPEDICFAACPHCGVEIEFWKDEPVRVCRSCRQEVMNPKRDFGCAEWCRHASVCAGSSVNKSVGRGKSGETPLELAGEDADATSARHVQSHPAGSKGSTRGAEALKVPASAAASQPAERGGETTADPSAATG